MFNIVKESFHLTNKFIVLATPLILFSLLSSLYLLFSSNGNTISVLIAAVLFFLMFGAFLSGWFFMLKKCVINSDEDPNDLIKMFPEGVGEYFLPVCGMVIISFIAMTVLCIIAVVIGAKTIGNAGITPAALSEAFSSNEALKSFVASLSEDQLIKITKWNLVLFVTMTISYFLIMFYPTVLVFKKRNPFVAFFVGVKDVFSRKFFKNVFLFCSVFFLYLIVSILLTLASANIFAHFVFTLLHFYYIVFAAVYIFNYYYKNYIQIGSNIDMTV